MWTIIFNKETKQIVGHASFETTMENLGSYDPNTCELQHIENPTFPVSLNSLVVLGAGSKIVNTVQLAIPLGRNPLAEIDEIKATLIEHDARLKKEIGGHIR